MTLSFAKQVKEEAASSQRDDGAKRAFLSAFARISGYLVKREGKVHLELSSESAKTAKTIYGYVRDLYGIPARFSYTRSAGFLKRIYYHTIIDEEATDILNDLEVDYFDPKEPKHLLKNPEQIAGYLSGAFLASGSVNSPSSTNYHLEIALKDEGYAKWLSRLWNRLYGGLFESKVINRRGQWVCYLKKSDQISNFLILLGAKECCLRFENARVDRDFANVTNRLQNLDAANYGKASKAAERQIEEIHLLLEKTPLEEIENIKLRSLIEMRLEHPDATLNELATLLSEQWNTTISKSNVNHLFRALHEMTEDLG